MSAPDLTPDEMGEVARFGVHDAEVAPDVFRGAEVVYMEVDGVAVDPKTWDAAESPWDPITPERAREKPASVACEVFMSDHNLSRGELAELLREYRSESGWSAFEFAARGVLDSEFLNWHEWERLG